MGSDHSRVVERDEEGNPTGRLDLQGAQVRLAHSLAFFIGTAYESTRTAEKMAHTVRAMHHTVKGIRPDGLPYDADGPESLRWNYATVVWGVATAHELDHPMPLRDIDRYYREFVRVGHALGGTDLPATKAETLDCLRSYLPRLALTHGAALSTGPNLVNNPEVPQAAKFFDWAIRDAMPDWAAELISHRAPHPVERAARRGGHLGRDQRNSRRNGPAARVSAGPAARGQGHDRRPHRADLRSGQRYRAQPGQGRADAVICATGELMRNTH
jgi:hypothetical protein